MVEWPFVYFKVFTNSAGYVAMAVYLIPKSVLIHILYPKIKFKILSK